MEIQKCFMILFLSIFSPIIPLVVGRKHKLTLLWLYVLTGFCFEIIIFSLRQWKLNYYWADNLFFLSEFIFISFIYRKKIFKSNFVFCLIGSLILLYFIVTTLSRKDNFFKLNEKGASLFYLCYIIYSILGFNELLKKKKIVRLETVSFFWVNCAFLILGSGTFLIFLFIPYFQKINVEILRKLWSDFFLIVNILTQLLLALALSRKTLD